MRSGLGVGTRGDGRGMRRSALDSDKWGRWRPLVVVGGADGDPGQRRWGGVGGTACMGSPYVSHMVESRSMVNGPSPGPAPAAQARDSSSRLTRSSWRTWPHRKLRRKVPRVDGALTAQPMAPVVPPVRNTSASSMQSPPASAEATRVSILSPVFARPGASPRSTWLSTTSRRPRCWARVTGRSSPALATSRVSSKAIRMRSGWLRASTLLPLQDTDPTPSFGGFGLRRGIWGRRPD